MKVNTDFTGSITAIADFNPEAQYKVINFYYDHNGLRTRKVVWDHGVTETYDYTLHGTLITHMTKRTVDENGDETTQELHFFYDSQSKPAFVEFEGERYRYVHSLQGDIIAIVDSSGNTVVEYKYDAWGKTYIIGGVENSTIGSANPFKYRRYVYDEEERLYYLNSRYYDAEKHRHLNADILINSEYAGANLYAYCNNNPVCNRDNSGYRPIDALSVASEGADLREISCEIMNLMARERSALRNKRMQSSKSILQEALNEYREIVGSEFIFDMLEAGKVPYGDRISVSATVGFVYNDTSYGITDALSFLGFTGVSDLLAAGIAMASMYAGFPLKLDEGQISTMMAWSGQVSEKFAGFLDNGMHKRYTIVIKATDSTCNSKTIAYYKFEEGVYYNGVNISGIYMPNSLGTGVFTF